MPFRAICHLCATRATRELSGVMVHWVGCTSFCRVAWCVDRADAPRGPQGGMGQMAGI